MRRLPALGCRLGTRVRTGIVVACMGFFSWVFFSFAKSVSASRRPGAALIVEVVHSCNPAQICRVLLGRPYTARSGLTREVLPQKWQRDQWEKEGMLLTTLSRRASLIRLLGHRQGFVGKCRSKKTPSDICRYRGCLGCIKMQACARTSWLVSWRWNICCFGTGSRAFHCHGLAGVPAKETFPPCNSSGRWEALRRRRAQSRYYQQAGVPCTLLGTGRFTHSSTQSARRYGTDNGPSAIGSFRFTSFI